MIEHLSPSTVQSYRKCAKAVYFKKIEKLPDVTNYASTLYGTCMHQACDTLFSQKIAGVEYSVEDFKQVFHEKYSALADQTTVWGEDSKEHLMEQGFLACADFYNRFYSLKPIATEKMYIIEREGKLPIHCIADLITEDHTVYDYKFGRGLWGSAVSGEYLTNMVTYAIAYYQETGIVPNIRIIKQKWSGSKQPSGKKLWSHKEFVVDTIAVEKSWFDYYLNIYDTVELGIKNNIWLPAMDNNGLCKKCSYREKCGLKS